MLTLVVVAGCTSGNAKIPQDAHGGGAHASASKGATTVPTHPPTSAAPTPAVITTSFVRDEKVSPAKPVTVTIAHGRLTAVTMTNPEGRKVTGSLAPDGSSWHNTEVLGYGRTYTIVATGTNASGATVTKRETVSTATPDNQTAVYMDRTGDYSLDNGATYGVAIVPEMYFDESLSAAAKKVAEKAITVTTTPHVAGAWAWQDDQRMLWRPETYWPSGTRVTVSAKIYGVNFGKGLWGQADATRHFTIGRKQVTIATDSAPQAVNKVRVYNAAGHVIRTMNTSMGEHSGVTVNGNYINFYTLGGTYTVLEHDNPAYMSSDSYGLPSSNPQGYAKEPIYWSTKISVDGIYLHELDTTVWAQNSGDDVSHGCLNLDESNATWFFTHSLVGDPVTVKPAKGAPTLKVWQGGAWTVPWKTWLTGDLSNS